LELDGREAVGEEGEEEDNVEKRPMMTEAEKANYRQVSPRVPNRAFGLQHRAVLGIRLAGVSGHFFVALKPSVG